MTVVLGPLLPSHRSDLERIVRATGVFNDGEVAVSLELFDATFGSRPVADGRGQATGKEPQGPGREPQADYEFLGAFENDALVGYACFGPTPSTDGTYDLYWIAVHPHAQRSGAGAALMSEVEARLRDRRARMLVIETSSRGDYAPTRRFYHRRGYLESARLRDFYAPGDDRVVLTKRVAAFGRDADRHPIAPHTHE